MSLKMKVKKICEECGTEYPVKPSQEHRSKFCGNYCATVARNKARTRDLSGKRFGRWVAIKQNGSDEHGSLWLCHCDCGNEKTIGQNSLTNGASKSCGCYSKEVNVAKAKRLFTKHGLSHTPFYWRWSKHQRRNADRNWTLEMQEFLFKTQTACVVCGSTERLAIDHVFPVSKGYELKPGNAVILCKSCNSAKRDKDLSELPSDWQIKISSAAQRFKELWESD